LKRIELTTFHLFQICAFITSICTTLLLIRILGKEGYGQYAYYFAFAELLSTGILMGFDQSVNLIKNIQNLDIKNKVSIIFNAKLVVFIILIPIPFFFLDGNLSVILFALMVMVVSLFDISYIYMTENNMDGIAKNFFISKLIFLSSILLLLNFTNDYRYYLFGFIFALSTYVCLGIFKNCKINSSHIKISLLVGFNQLRLALPFGFSRIFIFIEMFVVLTIFKNILNYEEFGIFMISYTIAKLISAGIGIFITPIYNKITLSILSVKDGLVELSIIGLLFFSIIILIYNLFDFSFISLLLNIKKNDLDFIFKNAIIYSLTLYITSVIYSIAILARNKSFLFYIMRIVFLFNLN